MLKVAYKVVIWIVFSSNNIMACRNADMLHGLVIIFFFLNKLHQTFFVMISVDM